MFIYRLLRYVSLIPASFCTITLGYYIFTAIRSLVQKERVSFREWIAQIKHEAEAFAGNFTKILLFISLIATLITNTAVHQLVGIHNLKIKPEGTYCFYVEASQYGRKTYTVPAEIKIEKITKEVGDKERTYTYYYIERLVFTNGTEIEIDIWDSVQINKSAYHTDSDGDEWELTLLNKHAYSPQIEETNNADLLGITILAFETLPVAFFIFALCWKNKNNES
jgi:hypothetical protein